MAETSKSDRFEEKEEINKYKSDYVYSSSPGLSDVSAESLSSSDVEKECLRSRNCETKTEPTLNKASDTEQDASATKTESERIACNEATGVSQLVIDEQRQVDGRNGANAKYTSLVMITNDVSYQQVNVVTTDTTKVVPGEVVVVSHTNRQDETSKEPKNYGEFFLVITNHHLKYHQWPWFYIGAFFVFCVT